MFCKTGVLRDCTKFTGKDLRQSLFFNIVAGLRLALVFSCEFCEISKNTFLHRTPLMVASENCSMILWVLLLQPVLFSLMASFQNLCKEKLEWDNIDILIIFYRTQKTSELHWFSDASQQSHGAYI